MTNINDVIRYKSECSWYNEKNLILENRYEEYKAWDFYRYIFPKGTFEEYEPRPKKGTEPIGKRSANTILVRIRKDKDCPDYRNTIIFDDLLGVEDADLDPFCIISPISYRGRRRLSKNAHELFALTIDLDGCSNSKYLDTLLYQMSPDSKGAAFNNSPSYLPPATFIVNSGHGLHLYYVLDKPIRLYPNVIEQINTLKKVLTRRIWTNYTSSIDEVQYQSIWQGFRVIGSCSKLGENFPVRAFKFGDRISINELINYLPQTKNKTSIENYECLSMNFKVQTYYENELSLREAQEKYPEWYMRKIVGNRDNLKYKWHVKRALYDWFKNSLEAKATFGHRYHCIRALTAFAVKCDIDYYELEKDAYSLLEPLDNKTPVDSYSTQMFKESDIADALSGYNDSQKVISNRFKRTFIEDNTAIKMPPSVKRNGRKQEEHMKRITALRDIDYPNGTWRNYEGRPKGSIATVESSSKAQIIKNYLLKDPTASKSKIKDRTGLTYPTIRKWYPLVAEQIKNEKASDKVIVVDAITGKEFEQLTLDLKR